MIYTISWNVRVAQQRKFCTRFQKKSLPSILWQTGGNVLSLWLLISINTGKSFHHISIESLLRQSTPQGTVMTLPVIDCQRVGVIIFIASTPCDEGSSVNLTGDCIRTLPRGGMYWVLHPQRQELCTPRPEGKAQRKSQGPRSDNPRLKNMPNPINLEFRHCKVYTTQLAEICSRSWIFTLISELQAWLKTNCHKRIIFFVWSNSARKSIKIFWVQTFLIQSILFRTEAYPASSKLLQTRFKGIRGQTISSHVLTLTLITQR